MKFTLINLVIDADVLEFDSSDELKEYLEEEIARFDSMDGLNNMLVSEWSDGNDILQQKFVSSIRADRWLAEH